jgi:GNAT superfamily N-acetyltransferase
MTREPRAIYSADGMIDPSIPLKSFEKAVNKKDKALTIRLSELDLTYRIVFDNPEPDVTRITIGKFWGRNLIGYVQVVPAEDIEGVPAFGLGWAVSESHQRKGYGKQIVEQAVIEVKDLFAKKGLHDFWLEAIVGDTNKASNKVAVHSFGPHVKHSFDTNSGAPIFQYWKRIQS